MSDSDKGPADFKVWLVRHLWREPYTVEPFTGGPIPEPFGYGIQAIYGTEEEARKGAERGEELYPSFAIPPPKRAYDEPCAWLVAFITLAHHVEVSVVPDWSARRRSGK